ncbi:retropepsin-like aspartic protease [Ekhidna sp.]
MKVMITSLLLILSFSILGQEVGYVKMQSYKKPIVKAEINGKKGYFLIDTGSDISIINYAHLKKYKLEASKVYGDHKRAMSFNGEKTAAMRVRNVEVVLGDRFDHKLFYSLNLTEVIRSIEAKTNIKINGIIGTDLLAKYNCMIDYSQRRIILVDSRSKHKFATR